MSAVPHDDETPDARTAAEAHRPGPRGSHARGSGPGLQGDAPTDRAGAQDAGGSGGQEADRASNKDGGVPGDSQALIQRLDAFLDAQAEGHRHAMEQVVSWLEMSGRLEEEIHASVQALAPIFQKWSFEICFLLRMRGRMRFNHLKEELGGIGSRTLSQRLKELEAEHLVRREAFAEVPVRVEYSLTPKGMRFGDLLMPVIAHLRIWGSNRSRPQR